MQDKPLSRQELDLLALVIRLHGEDGPVTRDVLSVRAKGRGLEFSRSLRALQERGLVQEILRRPSLLRRLFGAGPVPLLQPSEAGVALARAHAVGKQAREQAAEAPSPGAVPEAPAPAAPEPAPTPAEPAPTPAEPAPAPAAEKTAPSLAPRPRPGPAVAPGFADDADLPLEGDTVPLAAALDPETIEEVREVVAGLGMELTFAGEALMGSLVSRGEALGDALCRMLLVSFAHAVREDAATGGKLSALGLRDYVVEVMQELEKLRDAGFIGEPRFEEDMRSLWSMFQEGASPEEIVGPLLADPVAGITPPALLPEDLRPFEGA